MEPERIALSQRERDRLKVLHEVKQKHLTQVEAAARLKVGERQVRRMLLRLRERGDHSLVHGLRGRPSNRKLAARLEQKILARLRQRYADFGPTLAAEQLRGDPLRTQFGRAWNELGIEWIAAHSPQAKGRIERLFETLQDRLVKEMRLAGIDSIQGANHFLEMRFLPEWEQRFTVVPRLSRNAHRPLGREQRLEEILSVRVTRPIFPYRQRPSSPARDHCAMATGTIGRLM
jgi:transposase